MIVFGTLMGTMYIGQQFLQNVLGYDPRCPGAGDPDVVAMVAVAALSAKMVVRAVRGRPCCSDTCSSWSASR